MSDLRDPVPPRRDERIGLGTYLTPEEAKEFHKLFIISFLIFTAIAVVAHVLAWNWRPWGGHYAMVEHGAAVARATVTTLMG